MTKLGLTVDRPLVLGNRMANVVLKPACAGRPAIETPAEELLHALAARKTANPAGPTLEVVAALAVLAGGIAKVVADVGADVANPVTALLGGVQQAKDLLALWPELVQFLADIGVKL
jgi:hypothetical protein